MSFVTNLDTRLVNLTEFDGFGAREGCAGVSFMGRVGSGKTTAAEILARAYLRAGFGGIVTAAKPGEVELWKRYCAEEGRSKSLILFDDKEGFNFISYLLAQQGYDGIGTVTDCLMRLLEFTKRAGGTVTKKGEEPFFEDTKRMLMRYAIPPLYAAYGTLSVADILRFIESAPKTREQAKSLEWMQSSFMFQTMALAGESAKVPLPKELLDDIVVYWTRGYPDVPERTRGNMVVTVTAALERFRHGRLQRAFCGNTTSVVPEMTYHGAVIVLAMPSLTWNEDGIIGQQLFKYLWQRAVLARNSLPKIHRERLIFAWHDEAQEVVNSHDESFLGLARESRACPVYLTQSLPAYYSKIGGDSPREDAMALVGKFGTHVFLANSCPETNEYAARMIGKVVTRRNTFNTGTSRSVNFGMSAGENENTGDSSNYGSTGSSGAQGSGHSFNRGSGYTRGTGTNWGENRGHGNSQNENRGYSETVEYAFEPGDFGRLLKTGGPANGKIVTGVWYQSGRIFKDSGTNTLLARFKQR